MYIAYMYIAYMYIAYMYIAYMYIAYILLLLLFMNDCVHDKYSNYGVGWGISPAQPIVILGIITAPLVLSPLKPIPL